MEKGFWHISEIQIIFFCAIELFNRFHQKFKLSATEEEQIALAEQALKRFGMENPAQFDIGSWGGVDIDDIPSNNDKVWKSFRLADIESNRNATPVPIPTLSNDEPIKDFSIGPYQ